MKLVKNKGRSLLQLLTIIKGRQRYGIPNRVWALLVLTYILLPADLLPDFIPIAGWLDDMGLLYIFLKKLGS